MRLSIVQTDPYFGETKRNIHQAVELMDSVSADLFVLPELFNTGYNFISPAEVALLSEDDDGFTMHAMIDYAKKKQCYLVFGYAEKAMRQDGEKKSVGFDLKADSSAREKAQEEEASIVYYNSSALVGPQGIIGRYRKVHLYYRENLFFAPGNVGFPVFDLPFGRVGMMICFDWFYPESARSLALNGAQLIAHPANLVLPYCPDGMITRCLENRVFAATADRVGREQRGETDLTYIGTSQIVSNKGRALARCSDDKQEVKVIEVDLHQADNKRLNEFNDLLNDRKPGQYQW